MALIDNDYFNKQMVTLGLKPSFTPPADVMATLIDEASDWVEAYCRRKFGAIVVTESHAGSGRRRLILNEYPVAAVTSITGTGWRGGLATAPALDQVRIIPGGLLELVDSLDAWRRDVTYTVTYVLVDPIPGPVRRATALKVVEMLDPQYFPGRTKNVELVTNVQEQIVTLLEDFRRERLA